MAFQSASGLSIGDVDFWRRPLEARMADFASLREEAAFIPVGLTSVFGPDDEFYAVIRQGTE